MYSHSHVRMTFNCQYQQHLYTQNNHFYFVSNEMQRHENHDRTIPITNPSFEMTEPYRLPIHRLKGNIFIEKLLY